MLAQVVDRTRDTRGILAEYADAGVARVAQEAAYRFRDVVVVDAEIREKRFVGMPRRTRPAFTPRRTAYRASSVLTFEDRP